MSAYSARRLISLLDACVRGGEVDASFEVLRAMGEANVLSELPTGLKNEVALFLVHELVAKCIVFADVNVVNL